MAVTTTTTTTSPALNKPLHALDVFSDGTSLSAKGTSPKHEAQLKKAFRKTLEAFCRAQGINQPIEDFNVNFSYSKITYTVVEGQEDSKDLSALGDEVQKEASKLQSVYSKIWGRPVTAAAPYTQGRHGAVVRTERSSDAETVLNTTMTDPETALTKALTWVLSDDDKTPIWAKWRMVVALKMLEQVQHALTNTGQEIARKQPLSPKDQEDIARLKDLGVQISQIDYFHLSAALILPHVDAAPRSQAPFGPQDPETVKEHVNLAYTLLDVSYQTQHKQECEKEVKSSTGKYLQNMFSGWTGKTVGPSFDSTYAARGASGIFAALTAPQAREEAFRFANKHTNAPPKEGLTEDLIRAVLLPDAKAQTLPQIAAGLNNKDRIDPLERLLSHIISKHQALLKTLPNGLDASSNYAACVAAYRNPISTGVPVSGGGGGGRLPLGGGGAGGGPGHRPNGAGNRPDPGKEIDSDDESSDS